MFAASRLRLVSRPLSRVAMRPLHVTARRFASADPPNLPEMMMNDPKIRETFEKLSRHPPAIIAMQKVGDIIKSKGRFEPGQPPSKMEVMKLLMDKEFRDAAQTLTTEMQNAGIEINPDVGLPFHLASQMLC
ncbi:uncharacterized protein NECHADRAFT_37325 [Fusarium vanettenii 77-13-4]|uniref:Uncharacterized protein n=1 Tax=Fusarium vanettenii (strain ATCC MYA-4622 / CBS 123669 / FGSC 9596 / NRRL 45880 / 77-13-4) TaxID=660122 RepID=C7ZM08_FUSV7|nr:uncharacterized protein NECHADRAFT_37325 [Fusarium vanettenii 77-13-4]EEU34993.1 hypothetical protein NECHADRAFT_37325 [Fusarium vanettenii 77-13-4]